MLKNTFLSFHLLGPPGTRPCEPLLTVRRQWGPYLLGGAGDNALLEAVGLLLKVFSSLVIP